MKLKIMLGFYALFLAISLLIPAPMFPGNWLSSLISSYIQNYSLIISALFNGLFYGSIMGLIFFGLSRKIGK